MNTADPRAALNALIDAFERHYDLVTASEEIDDDVIDAAAERVADAFDAYDGVLFDEYGAATPLIVFGADDDDDDEDDDFDDLDDDFDDFDDLEDDEFDDDDDDVDDDEDVR